MTANDAFKKCILLIDDDAGIRSVVSAILETEGYAVVCATDGADALGRLRGGLHPDLILLDLMMPGMNGWEFRDAQLNDPTLRSIPVVVLTGADEAFRSAPQLTTGEIMQKPIELEALLDVVQRRCDSARSQSSASGLARDVTADGGALNTRRGGR